MLGIRLNEEDERRFAAHARKLGRHKSGLARDWLLERLDREATDAEFRRHIALIANAESAEDREWHDAMANDVLKAVDEEDGGYDWGGRR